MRFLLLCLLFTVCATVARADFNVSGTFRYLDREFDLTGFTGVETPRPIRFADVKVMDNVAGTVLGTGETDGSGNFSFSVTDSQTRDVVIRVFSQATVDPTLKLSVCISNSDTTVYALSSSVFSGHASTTNLLNVDSDTSSGRPFNIFDNILDEIDYVAQATLNGARPTSTISCNWSATAGESGSFASGTTVTMEDASAYDDTIVLHEAGHVMHNIFSRSDSPGGSHSSTDSRQDMRLSFGEGLATYFCGATRKFRGIGRPDIYVNTTGAAGSGNLSFSYTFETSDGGGTGAACERANTMALWDIIDNTSSSDASPGSDDDSLQLSDGDAKIWAVLPSTSRPFLAA